MRLQLPDGSQPVLPSGCRWGSWRVAVDGGGAALGPQTFWGGVSEFHHCCFSCCVMLAKLPDISELWLPHPIKGGSPPATCLIAFRSRKGTNA